MTRTIAIAALLPLWMLAGSAIADEPADPVDSSEGVESGADALEEVAAVTPEVAAAQEAYERRIAGMLRFFWDNEVEGTSLAGLPVGHHTVEVQIAVASDGTVEDVQLGTPSGVYAIDALALRAVRGASPLPEPPPELRSEAGTCVIPAWTFLITVSPDRKRTVLDFLSSWDYERDEGLGVQPLRPREDPHPEHSLDPK
ncbi:MAG: energy transducer TonB [Deltaproteobacteria bacterium]|nr:energy transducer TonB [Deltaproteobacteria bacterium]